MFARTDRLMLRPIWPEDAHDLYNAIADEAIVRNLALAPWPYRFDDARNFAATEHSERFPNFMLFRRTDGAPQLIGSCGIGNRGGVGELGYWIARPYWGLGYASEGARAVIQVARAIGHGQLIAGHFTDNPASGHVLRKIGFQSTGQIQMRYSNGRGAKAACLQYELDLDDDMGDYFIPPPISRFPYDAQFAA
jgi:RimJ/RimL family protein N-acetyltransferase